MNYRTTKLLAETSVTTSGTEIIDVNILDIISRLILTWRVSKSKHGMDSYPHKDITKIELVDGSDVLFSMDGGQCQALCIYDRKCPTMNHGYIYANNSQVSVYGIDFGRKLFDPELALDPSRFRNLQLKVSYDVDVSDTGVATGYLEVFAEVFDEKVVSPVGVLMSKEHYSATPPASGYRYIDFPTDYPIRKLLVQGYQKSVEPWNNVIEARLDEDNEKRIPFDWDLEDYYRVMKGVWTPITERLAGGVVTTGQTFYVQPTDFAQVIGGLLGANYNFYLGGWQKGGLLTLYSETVDTNFSAIVHGFLPNHCFEFPFGDPMDIADWYDVTRLGSLRLRLKAGAGGAVGTIAVVLQQLRRY